MAISVTTPGRVTVKMEDREYGKPGPWLDLIHEVNRIRPTTFGPPEFMGTRPGADHYVEEYADADVQMRGRDEDAMVTIVSKTPDGYTLIRDAAERLGLEWEDTDETCDHGLSASLCVDPVNHYPPDTPGQPGYGYY